MIEHQGRCELTQAGDKLTQVGSSDTTEASHRYEKCEQNKKGMQFQHADGALWTAPSDCENPMGDKASIARRISQLKRMTGDSLDVRG